MTRAALQVGVRELAQLADVSPMTIACPECGEALYPRAVETIRAALEAADLAFTNGDEPGGKPRRAGAGTA